MCSSGIFVVNDDVYTEAVLDPTLETNIIRFRTLDHGKNLNRMHIERIIAPLELGMAPSGSTGSSSSDTARRVRYVEKYGYDPFDGKEDIEAAVDRE